MPRRRQAGGPLEAYRSRRRAGATPEPFSSAAAPRPGIFVIHLHAARQLHFDLRLEMDGVLQSWAVPRGPSLDPAAKRLAMKVEDHPLEYADFEGVIPQGNYGAGAVIVWDRGVWEPLPGPRHGLEHGKLLFDLRGYKLGGRWTLFRTRESERHWLLVKKADGFSSADDAKLEPRSILSNLTVEEMGAGEAASEPLRRQLRSLKAPRRRVDPATLTPMLAQSAKQAFSREGWIFEIKYDGYRLLAARQGGKAFLRYRRGQEVTSLLPEISLAIKSLRLDGVVVDGELVVLDALGRPSFRLLQRRLQYSRPREAAAAAVRLPATLFAFDLLAAAGFDLRSLSLRQRKEMLATLLPRTGPVRLAEHIEQRGEEMFASARAMGLEGIMAKDAASPYGAGRSDRWLKMRADQRSEFIIVGFTAAAGGGDFGALHLAAPADGGPIYAGRVGSGFSDADMARIGKLLRARTCEQPCCRVAAAAGGTWVKPDLWCEVRYKERTAAGHLRHPVFVRLIDPLESGPGPGDGPATVRRGPTLTHQDKVFWPAERFTKGDLINYYRKVSSWLLPYLRDRPVVLTRYPDGIEGKSFFQKDAPAFIPDWIRTETMWSEHAGREIRYFICDDVETLIYLANLGTIPFHVWSSRITTLPFPDWCILDLDPKEAPFAHVVTLALALRDLARELELECHIKTSGATGLHVLIPLGGQCTYEQSRLLAHLLARILVTRQPEIATTARSLAARHGRVYVDFLQNGHGRLLVSPFSVRPLPGAPVSTPLRWREVTRGLDVSRFTLRSLPRRLARMGEDPLRPVLDVRPDLGRALQRLEAGLGS